MKTSRTILIVVAMATALTVTHAQNFVTNNGVIIGSPGNPASPDGNFPPGTPNRANGGLAPVPPGGQIPPMPAVSNRFRTNSPWNTRTNLPWNVRSNGNMLPGTNGVQRVPVSSNLPRTSLQPPDSSLPPMTNAPAVRNPVTQPAIPANTPGNTQRQLDPNRPNNSQRPATPSTPPQTR